MTTPFRLAASGLTALTLLGTATAYAQDYPTRTIRIVASQAGAGGDFVARPIAQGLTTAFGQKVVVENVRGGVIAGELVASSLPDGYTLLQYGNTFWLLPLIRKQIPYDPARDFSPVSLVARSVNVLVVHPSLPVKSVKELIALARARPGQLNYGSAAPGTAGHLAAELFNSMAKVNIVRISFRGAASAITSVASGEVQLMFTSISGAKPHIEAARVRALAVTALGRSPIYPDLPTVAEAGLPGFEAVSVQAVFAPAGTPQAIVARLNQEIVRVLQRQDTKDLFARFGVEPLGSSPEQATAFIRDEVARMGEVIRERGIQEK